MKKLYLFIISISLLLACSKGSLDNTLAIEGGLFTKGGLSLDTASIVVGVGLNDTYWINRGITPEYLSTLSGGEEMTEVCQIPDKVLIKIPTAELVDICLSYPLGFDFLLSNDESYAIDFMINNFNGLTELANRTDGPDELINAYASINKTSILCQFIEAYAENLLSSPIFLSNLSSDAILLLKNVINKKIAYRSANGSLLIPQDRINNLQAKLNSDDPLFSSTNSSSYSSRETVINPILTPFGKIVPYAMNQEISRDSIELLTEQYVKRYAVQLVDSASNIYNCHAYAWASSRQVWINNPVNLYTTNDLYFQSDSNVAVIYYLGDHSAVQRKADDSGVYVSKWGNGPLVRHAASTVPALYQPNNRVNYSLPYIQGVDTGYSGENTYIYTMYHI